jgi:thiamine-phosphate pyrophosphorylase
LHFHFPSPLYAILDVDLATMAGQRPLEVLDAWLAAGARLVQLRAKSADTGHLLALADESARRCRAADALLIVNDRADVARMAGAGGVHVGQDDLTPAEARLVLGDGDDRIVVGRSTHTADQIVSALAEPIDYLAIGPVFHTASKRTGYDPVGLEGVRLAASYAAGRDLPVVAIGGITLARAREVTDAGAAAVAVISDLLVPPPGERIRAYLRALA